MWACLAPITYSLLEVPLYLYILEEISLVRLLPQARLCSALRVRVDIQHPKADLFFSPHSSRLHRLTQFNSIHSRRMPTADAADFIVLSANMNPLTPPQSHHSLLLDLTLTPSFLLSWCRNLLVLQSTSEIIETFEYQ